MTLLDYRTPSRVDLRLLYGPPNGTDDTASVTAAIARAAGGTVYIGPGTWIVQPMTITSRITLELDEGATVRLKDNATAASMVRFNADDCVIRGGGTIDGNRANQANGTSSTAMHGVFLNGHRCKALGLRIKDCFNDGVRIGERDDCVVDGCHVTGLGLSGSSGIQHQIGTGRDCYRTRITNNIVDFSTGSAATMDSGGIALVSGATHTKGIFDAVIQGNRVILAGSPVSLNPSCITAFWNIDRCSIVGNTCENGSMGFSIAASDECTVTGNTVRAPNYTGIEIAGGQRCTVQANTIDGFGVTPTGIISSGTSPAPSDSAIVGNTITGTTTAAISINNGDRTTITGNIINVTAARAILTNGPVDITIVGNILIGGGTGTNGIDAIRPIRFAISGNLIKGWAANGVVLSASSAVTLAKIAVVGNVFDSNGTNIALALSGGATLTSGPDGLVVQGNVGSSGDWLDWTGNVRLLVGNGSPEGVVTAGVGSEYIRTDGGAGTTHYFKESGTGSTGWVAK